MFTTIISFENLCAAWKEFIIGKKRKKDVAEFSLNLSGNLYMLHEELKSKTYRHGPYQAFGISDPKPRNIHKATVRDRVLHHAMYRILYPYFDPEFISDVYSCRNGKGTHRAINRFYYFARKVSKNNTRTCWALKCDIQKFFASIDHAILMDILRRHFFDEDTLQLVKEVVYSFETVSGKGLPLGNLTSQLLVNVYMNQFDQFIKHVLHQKYYIRYADDFIFLSENRIELEMLIPRVEEFLTNELKLLLHPQKVFIKTWASGIDFLGWVCFADHKILRTSTKRRMLKNVSVNKNPSSISSYTGLLKHGNAKNLEREIERMINQD